MLLLNSIISMEKHLLKNINNHMLSYRNPLVKRLFKFRMNTFHSTKSKISCDMLLSASMGDISTQTTTQKDLT